MKSPEEWSRCFNWNGQTEGQILYQIEAIQRDALLEAAEIAQDYAKKYADDKRFAALVIHDAILERSKTLTPHFHSTSGGKNE